MAATKTQIRIKPLEDRIVVIRTEAEEKTTGGILLPENAKEKPQQGKVVAVGPGKLNDDGTRLETDQALHAAADILATANDAYMAARGAAAEYAAHRRRRSDDRRGPAGDR